MPEAAAPPAASSQIGVQISQAERSPNTETLSELNALEKEGEKPAEEPAKKPEKEAPKPAEKEPVKPADTKPAAKPADEKKPADAPPTAQQSNFAKIKQKAEHAESELAKAQAELKELRERISKGVVPKEIEDKLTAAEQERKQLRDKIAEADFTQSEDYQNNFWKPHVQNWTRAMTAAMGMKYIGADGAERSLTKDEAESLLSLPESQMAEKAEQLFGVSNKLLTLINHRQAIQTSNDRVNEAKANAAKLMAERQEKEGLTKAENAKRIQGLWQSTNEEITKSSPWFQESEDDKEGSELLKKGLAESIKAWSNDPNIPQEERLKLHAKMNLAHAAHERLVAAVGSRDARIAELEKSLKEYQASEPEVAGRAHPPSNAEKSTLEELRELERSSR